MKLTTKKLLYQKKNNLYFFFVLIVVAFISFPLSGYSQKYNFKFNNTTVSDALLEVAQKTNIRISFDASLMEGFIITRNISSDSISSVLYKIIEDTGCHTIFKHNTWLIAKPYINSREKTKSRWISGIIYDKETGERLPYATIFISQNGQYVFTTVDGIFSTKIKETNSCGIFVKYIGYETLDTIVNLHNTHNSLHLGLQLKQHNIATINVKGKNLEMLDILKDAGHATINPKRFSDLPNYGETDVFRTLQLLPGISAQENSAQLNIRGSSADQNLVTYDGFTLYNLDHFFGVFSAINPNVIKDIQVFRGGFDSRYGERVAGIVEITGKSGNKTKPQIYGGVNLISANLITEIPVTKKLTMVAAARRAYTDVFSSWLADEILAKKTGLATKEPNSDVIDPEFYFNDYNAKITWSPNEKENISFSVYGAKDYLNGSYESKKENISINTDDINKWGNYGMGVSWKKQFNQNFFGTIQTGHSGYYNDYNNFTTYTDSVQSPLVITNRSEESATNEKNKLLDYFISLKSTLFFNNSHTLDFGLSTRHVSFEYYKDDGNDIVYSQLNDKSMLYTGFLQDQITWKKFKIKPGLRLNYYSETKKFYTEPRLALNYDINDKIFLKAATGRYYQYLNKSETEQSYGYSRDFWVLADGNQKPVVKALHYILGAGIKTQKFSMDIEAYYKNINGLQEFLYNSQANNSNNGNNLSNGLDDQNLSKFISGKGKAYGIDFLIKYQNTNFTSWLSYSLSKSNHNFDEINNGDDIPALCDQTHELKWTNMYPYKKWNFSSLMIYTTGHPYVENYENDGNFNVTRTYNRLQDYFRVDLAANYNFKIKKVHIKPGLSLLNVFNTENYLDVYIYNFNFDGNPQLKKTYVKAQDITLNFFVNFKF